MTPTTSTRPAAARELRRNVRETLPVAEGFEFREGEGDTPPRLVGIAARTNIDYQVNEFGRSYTERIEPGAFKRTLSEQPDVVLLVEHSGLPLARTTANPHPTLHLRETGEGLEVEAELDPTDPDVARLLPKMKRGDMSKMSIGFRVSRDEWDENYERREISAINLSRGDVSVVTFPASETTNAVLRSALADDEVRAQLAREFRAEAEAAGETTEPTSGEGEGNASQSNTGEPDAATPAAPSPEADPEPDEDEATDEADPEAERQLIAEHFKRIKQVAAEAAELMEKFDHLAKAAGVETEPAED